MFGRGDNRVRIPAELGGACLAVLQQMQSALQGGEPKCALDEASAGLVTTEAGLLLICWIDIAAYAGGMRGVDREAVARPLEEVVRDFCCSEEEYTEGLNVRLESYGEVARSVAGFQQLESQMKRLCWNCSHSLSEGCISTRTSILIRGDFLEQLLFEVQIQSAFRHFLLPAWLMIQEMLAPPASLSMNKQEFSRRIKRARKAIGNLNRAD